MPDSTLEARVADLNRDGISDVVASGHAGLQVLLFGADGAPAAPTTYAHGFLNDPIMDVDGDGFLDLASPPTLAALNVDVLYGNGQGAFAPPIAYAFPREVSAVAAKDLNHDGLPDLIAAGRGIHVRLATGPRAYTAATSLSGVPPTEFGDILSVEDFDGDGHQDIVLGWKGTIGLLHRRGAGDGSFGPSTRIETASITPESVRSADVNRDGIMDAVYGTQSTNVCALVGRAAGTPKLQCWPTHASNTRVVSVLDLDADGRLDFVTGANSGLVSFSLQAGCVDE